MTKKPKLKARVPRKPVFERALQTAEKRLVKATAERVKASDRLGALSQEIPKLENIIRVLGGKSDVGQVTKRAGLSTAEFSAIANAPVTNPCPHVSAGEAGYLGTPRCFMCTFPNATVEDLPDDTNTLLS
jgi:hypothetical protein